jgi:hypothetical protein
MKVNSDSDQGQPEGWFVTQLVWLQSAMKAANASMTMQATRPWQWQCQW